jgi:NAD(P)-dependent dehydrogenase (short-subunit alcohol dehydrogenase family)
MMSNFCNLSGKKIVITGASSGLGRATSIAVSKLGATVCLIGRNEERLAQTVSEMEGGEHIAMPFDLQDFPEYKNKIKHIAEQMGDLHGFAHFAGIRKTLPLKVLKASHVRETMETHLFAFIEFVKFFSKKGIVSPNGGAVVVASSVAALRGAPALTDYSASKAAADAAVRCLACELASRKIRVNSVAPGHIDTEMNLAVKETLSMEAYDRIVNSHPLGVGKPEDVANLTAFLLSDEARWITGATIPIDGGFNARS